MPGFPGLSHGPKEGNEGIGEVPQDKPIKVMALIPCDCEDM